MVMQVLDAAAAAVVAEIRRSGVSYGIGLIERWREFEELRVAGQVAPAAGKKEGVGRSDWSEKLGNTGRQRS